MFLCTKCMHGGTASCSTANAADLLRAVGELRERRNLVHRELIDE